MSNQRFHLVILALVASLIGVPAVGAQPSPNPFGADVFVGGFPRPDPVEGEEVPEYPDMGGWQVGASIRRGVKWQWLGWTGSYGSRSNDDVRVRDALGGVSATSPWLLGGEGLVRAFGQALGGYAWSQTALGLHDSAPMFVAGGGFDIFFFRLQVDYVRTQLTGVDENYGRGFLGGMVPLCFTDCRPEWEDGIPLFGARSKPR